MIFKDCQEVFIEGSDEEFESSQRAVMKNLMISKKQRQNKAENFSGVEVGGQEVFMEGSNEEFDDLEEIKVEKGKLFQLCLFIHRGLYRF